MRTPPLLLAGALSILLAACTSADPVPADVPDVPGPPAASAALQQRCFLNVTRSTDGSIVDSMRISLIRKGDGITGRMDWLPGAKDRMTGTLEGTMRGDLVYVFYDYMAEGTRTIEQRVFRLASDHLSILDGDIIDVEGGWELRDPAAAKETMRLVEVPCP